jgi:two-component system, NtrC family, sensor histidine kinase HydH
MTGNKDIAKMTIIIALAGGISLISYLTPEADHYYHVFSQELYFLPLILAAFWFGMRGALAATVGISALYLPFMAMEWKGFSPADFGRMMELITYVIVGGTLAVLRKREERKQKSLREAESLAGIGRAISGVAHDLKTPLIAIGGFTKLVMGKLPKDDPNHEKLAIVMKETARMEKLVKDMLDFSKPALIQRSMEDLRQIIGETLDVMATTAAERGITVKSQVSEDLPSISMDADRIKQVLINLVVNAIQASPDGGSVGLRGYRKGRALIIDVSDSGCGIPDDKKEEVFLPFVTTKKQGTGLGLCIVKKIVEAHDGYLKVLDNSDKGVTFRVVIPMI